jgi:hypothetical protein
MDVGARDEAKRTSVEAFCCYARRDQRFLTELKKHLYPLQREGLITLWADVDINAGMEWEKEIDRHLYTAQIILLLISPDFMASDYCYGVEMRRAMERHEHGEARVIPIILRPVQWRRTPLGKLQALPANASPIMGGKWHHQDEAFYAVAEGIREAVEALAVKNPAPQVDSPNQVGEDISFSPNPQAQEEKVRQAEEEKRRCAEEATPSAEVEEHTPPSSHEVLQVEQPVPGQSIPTELSPDQSSGQTVEESEPPRQSVLGEIPHAAHDEHAEPVPSQSTPVEVPLNMADQPPPQTPETNQPIAPTLPATPVSPSSTGAVPVPGKITEATGTTGMAEARNRFGVLKAHMMTLFDGTGHTIFPRLNTSRYTGAGYTGRETPDSMASLILLDDDGGGVPSFSGDTTEMAVNQIEFPKMLWTEVVGKMQAGEVVEVTGEGQHIDWQGTYESGVGLVGVDTTPKPVHIKIGLSVSDDSRTLHLGFYKRNSDAQTDEPWIEYLNVTGSFE